MITLLAVGMLHIAHQDAVPVEVIPTQPNNFLLTTSREDRERDDFGHWRDSLPPSLALDEIVHELVQLDQGRTAIALSAFCDHTETLEDKSCAFDSIAVERIAPCWLSQGKNAAKKSDVVQPRCWRRL